MMRLCWNKRSLMVFSCFVSYKSYHKKGTLDFKQRMVKELSELLLTINHSFSTLMQTIHKQLYERTKIIAVIDATAKGSLFPTAKVGSTTALIFFHIILHPAVLMMIFIYFDNFIRRQFHSVNGTEISHMKIWREPKSLSARLIPVFKHCEHLCVGIYSEEREKHGAAWNNPPYTKPCSLLKNENYNHFRISF